MEAICELSQRLSAASTRRFANPFADFEWPQALQSDRLAFAPGLSTLQFLPGAESFAPAQVQAYLLHECVNFFSLNINGEKLLLQGMVQRLHRDYPEDLSSYMHHFVDEENKHMAVFARFCHQYGDGIRGGRQFTLGGNLPADMEDLLFFARIVIFEHIADHYNNRMMADQTLDQTVQRIHRMHHQDETRHLAFGRALVARLYTEGLDRWSADQRRLIGEHLDAFTEASWREYYNPLFMRDAGIADAYGRSRAAFECDAARQFRAAVMAPCRDWLVAQNILEE